MGLRTSIVPVIRGSDDLLRLSNPGAEVSDRVFKGVFGKRSAEQVSHKIDGRLGTF
jgi:hypothetical protein